MTDDKPLSRQALYQEKRRKQSGGQVTFFPPDKGALGAAVAASGKSQQRWLEEAVAEKIERDGF